MADIPDGVWTEYPLPAVEGRCWPEDRIIFENGRWQRMYRYPVPTIKTVSKLIRRIVSIQKRIKRNGEKPEAIIMSPDTMKRIVKADKYPDYNFPHTYGRFLGMDLILNENEKGIIIRPYNGKQIHKLELDPDL